MKNLTALLIISGLILVSCGNKKKEEVPKKEVAPKTEKIKVEKKVTTKGNAEAGKIAFGSKGCTACHHESTKIIGPPVKDIATI